MRSFWATIWAFLVRDTIIAVSYRLEFALRIATVIFHVTAIYFLSRMIGTNSAIDDYGGYLPFAAIGLAVASITNAGFTSCAKAIHAEQLHGTIEALLLAPRSLASIVVGSSAWKILWAVLVSIVYVVAAVTFYGAELRGGVGLALIFLLLTTLASAGLGILSASFVLVYKRGDPVAALLGGMSFLLGGVFYPVSEMPNWLQGVASLLPITHGLHGVREVLLRGAGLTELWPQLAVLVIFAGIGIPLGLLSFRYAIWRAQRDGTLLHY